ncbi:hypothetical protein IPG41_01340 [Candidatus Peregrinibacteria bacterium]|nr:MAG: hypothetical protein IPG41_01340 [Candidatus Peregrinibacteria bacterium]
MDHFKLMSEVEVGMKEIQFVTTEHHYHANSFGSWYSLVRYKGREYSLVFDGRDSSLELRTKDDLTEAVILNKPKIGLNPKNIISFLKGCENILDSSL